MSGTADVKESVDGLGGEIRGQVSRTAGPVKQGFKAFRDEAFGLTKKYPGLALGLVAAGGAVTGIIVARMTGPVQGNAERIVRHWVDKVHNAQEGWGELRVGLEKAIQSVRSAVNHLR